jgi:hypothetical protein
MDAGPPGSRVASKSGRSSPFSGPSTTLGLLLVLLGVLLLIGQLTQIDIGHYGWPLFVIVPGLILLVLALSSRGAVSEGLAILGSVLTISGLILLYQNATDHFESWAYAWALVFPGAIGIGMILYGVFARRPANVRIGMRLLGVGVILFLLGALFFEGVIGIGGYDFGRSAGIVIGVLVMAAGALLLIVNVTAGRARRSP